MTELLDTQFETYIDSKTGKQAIRIKQTDSNDHDGKLQTIIRKKNMFIIFYS